MKNLVVKSNELIEASYHLSLTEVKIFSKLVSLNFKENNDFLEIEISIKQLLEDLNIHEKNYKEIRLSVRKLLQRVITIETEEKEIELGLIAKAELDKKTQTYILKIHSDLKEYLLQLKKNFTKYQLENILKLKSFYSFRIYELLKQYESIKKRVIEIDDLKKYLGIEKKQYTMYSAFRTYILEKARDDLREFTDIFFDYSEIKTVRKITAIEFYIYTNKSLNKNKINVFSEEVNKLYDLIIEKEQLESRKEELKKLLTKHSYEYLEADIKYCNSKRPKNYWAYLLKSVENGHFSAETIEKEEKKKEFEANRKYKIENEVKEEEKLNEKVEYIIQNIAKKDLDEFEEFFNNLSDIAKTKAKKEQYLKTFIKDKYFNFKENY